MKEKEHIDYREFIFSEADMPILKDYSVDILTDYIKAASNKDMSGVVSEAVMAVSDGNIKEWGADVFVKNHAALPKEVHAYVKSNWSAQLEKYKPSFLEKTKGKSVSDLGALVSEFVGKFGDLPGSFSVDKNHGMIDRNYNLFGNTYVNSLPAHQSDGRDLEDLKDNLEYFSSPHSVKYLDKSNFIIEDSNLK
jgi:hypothetical protein